MKVLNNRYILYSGILLWVISIIFIITNYYLSPELISSPSVPYFDKLFRFSPFLMLVIIILIAPVAEEYIFRYWTKQNDYSYFVSGAGMTLVVFMTYKSFLPVFLIMFVLSGIYFFIKKSDSKLLAMAIVSTILFALLHIRWHSMFVVKMAVFFQMAGLSLILVWLGLRYRFLYCIAGHMVQNVLATLPFIVIGHSQQVVFENNTYKATLEQVSVFNTSKKIVEHFNDSFEIYGHATSIICRFLPFDNEIIYRDNMNSISVHHLYVNVYGEKPDYAALAGDYMKYANIKADTAVIECYTLTVTDSAYFVSNRNDKRFKILLYHFVSMLRQRDIPIKMEKYYKNEALMVDEQLISSRDIRDIRTILKKSPGVYISDEINSTIKQVTFSSSD